MKVLCIGNVSYDITFPMDGYPVENIKYRVDNVVSCGGGPASNAAYLLGKWGCDVYFAGVVGKDENGSLIKNEFKLANVNTKYLEIDKNHKTTLSFIIVNGKCGSRTIFTKRDNIDYLKNEIDIKPDIILVDGQEFEMSKKVLLKNKDAISVIDAGRVKEEVVELAKMCTYVVCSKSFAEEYTGINIRMNDPISIKEIYKKMDKDFKNVVITLEDKGALYQVNNKINLMPSIKVKSVDSTGAGDIFHGAFVYSLINNYDIDKSIKISNITGALSVTKLGGRYSVPTIEEVMEIYNKNV